VASASAKVIRAAAVLGVPVITTEQYVKGLGPTVPAIREAYADGAFRPLEKLSFSCCGAEAIAEAVRTAARSSVLVVGIEAHVCVQQTVLDLLALGYSPFVCADAIGSRRDFDRDTAIERMRQAGAVITTTESAIFELLGRAGTDQFKRILPIVK
jgi:nicotinamidase-related amidase